MKQIITNDGVKLLVEVKRFEYDSFVKLKVKKFGEFNNLYFGKTVGSDNFKHVL